jgi:hypothetical protein
LCTDTFGRGKATDEKSIRLNDTKYLVRNNLFEFFEHVELELDDYYWIDAICINQSNDQEKNHQVGMMKDIYIGVV